jgi:beta-galactosidase/beta-glucuronidase
MPEQTATLLHGSPEALPRSIARGRSHLLLDGTWTFELDPNDVGIVEKWYRRSALAGKATWPGSVEAHLQAAKNSEPAPGDQIVAWYQREFAIPSEWGTDCGGGVALTLGACGYETRVWLNGHPLTTVEGEEVHFGEYTSFSYELPEQLLEANNNLTIRVADSMDPEIPRGKQASRVYERGGIWYQTISGPVRSIWIEPVERNRLRPRASITSTIESRAIELELSLRIEDPGLYRLRVTVSANESGEPVADREVELEAASGELQQRVALEIPRARLWSPEEPNLYVVHAELEGGNCASELRTRFGIRTIETKGRSLFLNNREIYADGILYQPFGSSYQDARAHLLAIKRLGCNLVRVHIEGIDPRIYDLADELGLLMWIEVPSPHKSTATSRENHAAELKRMLVQVGTHPSIVLLSLYNEDWGAEDIATNSETREYIARTVDQLKIEHPSLLVVDNDGWRHVSAGGALKSSLLTAHVYTPSLERWRETLDRLVAGEQEGVTAAPLVVGDPFFYAGQLPLVISEWGGFGYEAYGGPHALDARAERILAFKRALRERAIAGDVYTQAIGIEEEQNGLIDPITGELLVPEGLLGSKRDTR